MRRVFGIAILVIGAAYGAIAMIPSDADHAAVTTPEYLAAFADPPGTGLLDGIRYDTVMGPPSNPDEVTDFLQFDHGLFMSRECTDRCNYPPSAYFARTTPKGTEFIIEAFCPTKDTTMVWRGTITGETVAGTVTWTSTRFYWRQTQTLSFRGRRSDQPAQIPLE